MSRAVVVLVRVLVLVLVVMVPPTVSCTGERPCSRCTARGIVCTEYQPKPRMAKKPRQSLPYNETTIRALPMDVPLPSPAELRLPVPAEVMQEMAPPPFPMARHPEHTQAGGLLSWVHGGHPHPGHPLPHQHPHQHPQLAHRVPTLVHCSSFSSDGRINVTSADPSMGAFEYQTLAPGLMNVNMGMGMGLPPPAGGGLQLARHVSQPVVYLPMHPHGAYVYAEAPHPHLIRHAPNALCDADKAASILQNLIPRA
jgi:hypothetical protein